MDSNDSIVAQFCQRGWEKRLECKLRSIGFTSLLDFLDSNPSLTYPQIAAQLEVAPILVICMVYNLATQQNVVRKYAKDSLRRCVLERFPSGWSTSAEDIYQRTSCLAGWSSELVVTGEHPELESTAYTIASSLRAPDGWFPSENDDIILSALFDTYWP